MSNITPIKLSNGQTMFLQWLLDVKRTDLSVAEIRIIEQVLETEWYYSGLEKDILNGFRNTWYPIYSQRNE